MYVNCIDLFSFMVQESPVVVKLKKCFEKQESLLEFHTQLIPKSGFYNQQTCNTSCLNPLKTIVIYYEQAFTRQGKRF